MCIPTKLANNLSAVEPSTDMKIFSTTTPAFREASERWLVASLRAVERNADLTIEHFGEISGSPDFQSEAFREHNIEKNRRLAGWIRANAGELIFVTDADIIYVRPFLRRLEEELGAADLALADEGPFGGYNIGQMVIRCQEPVAEFFEKVADELSRGAWDQEAVNRLLQQSGLVHRPLSPLFSNTSIWEGLPDIMRVEIFSFHATATQAEQGISSLERKQRRMEEIGRYLTALESPAVPVQPL